MSACGGFLRRTIVARDALNELIREIEQIVCATSGVLEIVMNVGFSVTYSV